MMIMYRQLMKIFGSKLTKLYKKGLLYIPLRYMKTIITEQNFISYDDYESCFRHGNQFLKLCSKSAKYFKKFNDNNAQNFKKLVSSLNYILLPIIDIIYEDEYVFAYTQPIYEKYDLSRMNSKSFFEMTQIERILLDNNVEVNISPNHMCSYDNRIVLFTYYNISPLILDDNWRFEVSKDILKNINWYYLHDDDVDYLKSLKNTHLPNYCSKFYYQLIDDQLSRLDLIIACDNFLNHVSMT